MSGPPPKDPSTRARRAAPARGEWVNLPPLERPVLGELPRRKRGRGGWSEQTRKTWKAWRADPVTQTYTQADIAAIETLIFMVEELHRGDLRWATEVRHRETALGLNPKGKRDLRYRVSRIDQDAAARGPELVGIDGGQAVSARERVLGA